MTSAIFLSVREKATRLPKKVLLDVLGRSMTEHLIARLKLAQRPDLIVVTTSTHPDDQVLCDIAARCGVKSFRGSEEDKLVRYRDAARHYGVDFMVVVDGDDIFCSEQHIDAAIEAFEATGADYVTQDGLPVGAACSGVKREAMEKVCAVKAENDTEVWGGYFTSTGLFTTHIIRVEDPVLRRPDVRMTLDYEEDLRFFTAVIEALYRDGRVPPFREIMEYLAAHPEVVALSAGAKQKYESHLLKSAPVRIAANAQGSRA